MSEGILGIDYVTLKGTGDREVYNGASVEDDDYIHLGIMPKRATACDKPFKEFMLTYSDVDITCPECVMKLKGN